MEELQALLESLRRMLQQYVDAERVAREQLDQVVQGRLMQAGAVKGVEMAIERVAKVSRPDGATGSATGSVAGVSGLSGASAGSATDWPPVSGLPSAADSADESGLVASMPLGMRGGGE